MKHFSFFADLYPFFISFALIASLSSGVTSFQYSEFFFTWRLFHRLFQTMLSTALPHMVQNY